MSMSCWYWLACLKAAELRAQFTPAEEIWHILCWTIRHHMATRVILLVTTCLLSGLYEYFTLFQNILENLHKLSFTSMSGVQAKSKFFVLLKTHFTRLYSTCLELFSHIIVNWSYEPPIRWRQAASEYSSTLNLYYLFLLNYTEAVLMPSV